MTTTHHPLIAHDSTPVSRHGLAQKLVERAIATTNDAAPTVARVALGGIIFPHGAQHSLGWFGGYGFSGTLGWMTGTLGFSTPAAVLGLIVEPLFPLLMLLGVGGRLTAAVLFGFMATAGSTHLQNGFFMNWFGSVPSGTEGFEYHLLTLALAAVVMIKGSGAFSLDRLIQARSVRSS
jgi:putative oxidoreductase